MAGTADFDQDGKPDILWRHDTSGRDRPLVHERDRPGQRDLHRPRRPWRTWAGGSAAGRLQRRREARTSSGGTRSPARTWSGSWTGPRWSSGDVHQHAGRHRLADGGPAVGRGRSGGELHRLPAPGGLVDRLITFRSSSPSSPGVSGSLSSSTHSEKWSISAAKWSTLRHAAAPRPCRRCRPACAAPCS